VRVHVLRVPLLDRDRDDKLEADGESVLGLVLLGRGERPRLLGG